MEEAGGSGLRCVLLIFSSLCICPSLALCRVHRPTDLLFSLLFCTKGVSARCNNHAKKERTRKADDVNIDFFACVFV
jgi:hypothetical protein